MGFLILSILSFIIGAAGVIYDMWDFHKYSLNGSSHAASGIGGIMLI